MAVSLDDLLRENLAQLEDQRAAIDAEISKYKAFISFAHKYEPKTQTDARPENGNGNGGGHKPLSEKREAVLAIMRERPGRWTTKQLRAALAKRGIDPHAGTPVKNILWHLAKAGVVHASGKGVYEFPALSESANDREQEAMAV